MLYITSLVSVQGVENTGSILSIGEEGIPSQLWYIAVISPSISLPHLFSSSFSNSSFPYPGTGFSASAPKRNPFTH
jgi:hypothetical protein